MWDAQPELSELYKDLLPWSPLLTLMLVALVTMSMWRQRQTPAGPSNQDIRRIWAEQLEKEQREKPKASQKAKPGEAAAKPKKAAKEAPEPVTQKHMQQQWMQRHQSSTIKQDKQQKKPVRSPKAKPGAAEEAARLNAALSAVNQTSAETEISQLAGGAVREPSTTSVVLPQVMGELHLREYQATEFAQALAEDLRREAVAEAKIVLAQAEQQAKRDEEQAALVEAAAVQSVIAMKRSRIPTEPAELKGEGIVQLQIKLPFGEALCRRFRAEDSVQVGQINSVNVIPEEESVVAVE